MLAGTPLANVPSSVSFDQRVMLDGVSRAQYEALMETRGERSNPRLTYLDGCWSS